jgi:glycosyltransferase involved in cell wall biosynthesis
MDVVIAHFKLSHRGGAEKVVLDIARKFNPIIYTSIYDPEKTFKEFKEFDVRVLPPNIFERIPLIGRTVPPDMRFFNAKLKDDYDVINAHHSCAEFIRNHNSRVCWTLYTPFREVYDNYERYMKMLSYPGKIRLLLGAQIFKVLESRVINKIEKICPISEVANDRLKKYLNRYDGEVIHPGINPKEFSCERFDKFFFYPSRLNIMKRHVFAIEAFRLFSKKRKGWKLIIAGFANDNDLGYLPKLKKLAADENIEIQINPSQEKMHELYSNCYAMLFSAIDEDYGLVLLEAMASRKPCISVNEGGPKYIVKNDETGYLVSSPEKMAEKMEALAENQDLVEDMGKAGKHRVERNFTTELFLNKTEKAFKSVVKMSD